MGKAIVNIIYNVLRPNTFVIPFTTKDKFCFSMFYSYILKMATWKSDHDLTYIIAKLNAPIKSMQGKFL